MVRRSLALSFASELIFSSDSSSPSFSLTQARDMDIVWTGVETDVPIATLADGSGSVVRSAGRRTGESSPSLFPHFPPPNLLLRDKQGLETSPSGMASSHRLRPCLEPRVLVVCVPLPSLRRRLS
jgi:hypothetical protein